MPGGIRPPLREYLDVQIPKGMFPLAGGFPDQHELGPENNGPTDVEVGIRRHTFDTNGHPVLMNGRDRI